MNAVLFAVGLLAQAVDSVDAAANAVAANARAADTLAAEALAATPWWREGWAQWGLAVLTIVVPVTLAWLLAKRLRASDMWGRLAAVLTAIAVGGVIVWLGWPPRLGIDLKGGVILVYQVDTSKQAVAQVDDAVGRIEQVLATPEERLGTAKLGPGGRISVRIDAADAGARAAAATTLAALELDEADLTVIRRSEAAEAIDMEFAVAPRMAAVDMDKLVGAVSRRVNPGGQKEVTVRRYGLDQLEVIVPEVDQSEVDLIKRIVSSAGVLEFRILANPEDPRHKKAIELGSLTAGTQVSQDGTPIARWIELDTEKMSPAENRGLVTRTMPDGRVEVLVMLDRFDVTGGDLGRVSPSFDQNLAPCVNFTFNSRGAARFGLLTGQNVPDPANRLESRLGILLDDVLQSAPTIRSRIDSSGQITGNFKQSDIDFLVEVLNAGSLPAALESEPISEQKISPQLGADTIQSGARAMLLATIAVLTFMLLYYRLPGVIADLAVLLNILLVLALMISLKAAFTLAGLAGLVLSVGMSVDANVLIYERMREELDRGAAVRMAIRNGFQRAFSTIVDSNLTTLITGIVLFAIGTDQLKGFAVTLILGLTLNLFTAVFCSRVAFDLAERNRWITRLSMTRLFGKTDLQFVRWMRPAIVWSLLFIGLGLAAAWSRGQGLFDIDFTGGTSVQVAFQPDKGLDSAAVRKAVSALPDVAVSSVTAGDAAPDTRYKIDSSLKDAEQVEAALREAFPGRLATYSMGFGEIESSGTPPLSTVVALDFPERINRPTLEATLEQALAAADLAGTPLELEAEGMTSRLKPYRTWSLATSLDPDKTRGVLEKVAAKLAGTPVYLSANMIGGKVAGNTQVTAVYALLASLVMIVLYVWVRFQNVAFGLAAVVALLHDVLVAIGCLALSRFVAPYLGWALVDDFKISLDVVAALLTIVGFSINDTIVIFDRIREIRGKSPVITAEMVDRAVNQTLSRTILTSGTTFIAALILYLLGGQGIHAFAFTMLVGIVAGTYSTIYIAAPIVLWLQHRTGATQAA
jgi:SecD/SecF fusion protein